MKSLAIAATLLATAIGLAGCSDQTAEFPSEARVQVVYSPEVSALWNKMYPPINLRGGKEFKYVVYDRKTEDCIESASIDGLYVYDWKATPERCGTSKGAYFSVMITYSDQNGYRVFVPASDISDLARDTNDFNDGFHDEFLAQFMTTTAVTQCTREVKHNSRCDEVLRKYQVESYAESELPKNKMLPSDNSFSYYPESARKMQGDLKREGIEKIKSDLKALSK